MATRLPAQRLPRVGSFSWLSSLLLAAGLAGCGGGGGDSAPVAAPPPAPPPVAALPGSYADPVSYSGAATAALASAQEGAATVQARVTLEGRPLDYTAVTGHLTATDLQTGQPA